jgi:hypothetical protein
MQTVQRMMQTVTEVQIIQSVYAVADEVEPDHLRDHLYAALELAFETWAPASFERVKVAEIESA